jgi:BMFP domain-containing protein YqiC
VDRNSIEDLAKRLADSVPGNVREVKKDLESNFKSLLQSALGKMDLVTREEFDVQTKVLARTREKLEALESEIATLEAQVAEPPAEASQETAQETTRETTQETTQKAPPNA